MKTILSILCVLFFSLPVYGAVDVGNEWGFWGDSETDDEAANSPKWTTMIAPTTVSSYVNGGRSGSALTYLIDRYEAYSNNGELTWVHFQESGNQNHTGQRTAQDFGDTFEEAVRSIATNSPNAVISYETAFSFGREAESYRNWDDYNDELRARIDDLEAEGITVILCDVDANIKALQTEIGDAREIWCQSDEGCAYHYKDLGNVMVALTIWASLGYTVGDLDLTDSEITDLVTDHVDAALAIAFNSNLTERTLTISPRPTNGTITSSDNLINCGSGAGEDDCTAVYSFGTVVSLSATPDNNYDFSAWSGNLSSSTGTSISITMTESKLGSAIFTPVSSSPDKSSIILSIIPLLLTVRQDQPVVHEIHVRRRIQFYFMLLGCGFCSD